MVANVRTQFGSPTKTGSRRVAMKGRVCGVHGCTTVLSIYNGQEVCSVHETPRLRTVRPSAD